MDQIDSEAGVRSRLDQILAREDQFLPVAVARDGSRMFGYGWVQDYGMHLRTGKSVARLNDLFVAGEYRRGGIGTRLLAAVVNWADERGVTWLQWQSSIEAMPFYARLGFDGDPCPDPEHPFFEIEVPRSRARVGQANV